MRVTEKSISSYPWYLRPFFWNQKRKYGQILKPALLWASLLWPASILAADNNVEQVLPLAQLIQEALDQNPEIKAAEQRWVSA
ncbi:MAG: hypothetical protein ACXW1U_18755 [Methylobacter sp.]